MTYTWRDRKTGEQRSDTLPLLDFVRRFARHILPKGFRRIRSYGLLSPAKRAKLLPKAQAAAREKARLRGFVAAIHCSIRPERLPQMCCEACGAQRLKAIAVIRGSVYTMIHPQTYPIPPPEGSLPARREALL